MISTKIDLQNKQLFADQVQGAGEREVARVTFLSLPYAGAWLTCAPIPALGLHMRGPEFVVAVKFRLGLNRYDKAGKCPSCGKESDELGDDHGMVCGTAQCVLCSVYFSAQPNKLRPILKFKKYYPIEHIFVPACLSARKIHFFKF